MTETTSKVISTIAATVLAVAVTACGSNPDLGRESTGRKDAVRRDVTEPGTLPSRGDRVADFEVDALYLDDSGGLMGTRWVHVDHGMPVTVLRIQSVPQVFLHVNTPPISDRGEPHTGEHLLLGKGNKGKHLAVGQDMSLVGSTAYTSQTDVVYAWNCAAGKETFLRSVDQYLDALLLPDYTDEEVRREVCNLGVARDGKSGLLEIEEKGTIYNEMVASFEKRWCLWNEHRTRMWGKGHPLSFSSGGIPAAVRQMEPHHIHDFHRSHYHLSANIGIIAALPDEVPETEFLERLSATARRLDATPELRERPKTLHPVPPARPEESRGLRVVPYPNRNEDAGGIALFSWAPVQLASQRDLVLAQALLATVGSGESATLYKRLMDGETREVEVDASSLGMWLDVGKVDVAAFLNLGDFPRRNADPKVTAAIADVLGDEFRRVAALAPGSPELEVFNRKCLVSLVEWRKDLRKQLGSPPLFGHRSSGGFWLGHLRLLDKDGGFERVVTLGPLFDEIRGDLIDGKNPWTQVVADLGLLGTPYVTVSVPSVEEAERRESAKRERLVGYERDLQATLNVDDGQAALARYLGDYEAKTNELRIREAAVAKPPLVDDVPLTPDPSLLLDPLIVVGVPGFRGAFETMSFVEVSLSFDLNGVDPRHYVWLPLLPTALTGSGHVEDGKGVPYDEAQRRRTREIYGLSAEFSMRPSRGRHEFRITASGADVAETKRAILWMERSLHHPWLTEDNLPRVRDLVRQAIRGVRGTLGGREERWVHNPANALAYQDDPLYLSASSHHAGLLHLARIDWMLTDPPDPAVAATLESFLAAVQMIDAPDPPAAVARIQALLGPYGKGEEGAGKWIVPVGRRIRELAADTAPGSVGKDLRELVRLAREGLAVEPATALAELDELRRSVVERTARRFVLTGSRTNTDGVIPRLAALLQRGNPAQRRAASPVAPDGSGTRIVATRLRDHEGPGPEPVHHALVHGAGTSGVFVIRARTGSLQDLDEETLLDDLAARVFGGQGPHGFFMKTWGAGLAYSNGLAVSPNSRRIRYYAERCPGLVETMRFVTGLVKAVDAMDDPYLAEYAVAQAVRFSRASNGYESRTRAAADEIEDGDTPERTAAFRRAVLDLRGTKDLWSRLKPRIVASAGRALPGVGPRSRDVTDGVFLVIAPERLIADWEDWVKKHEGDEERVYRIYPRDFWVLQR